MNNEAIEQIERMVKQGKISDEDRKRLEERCLEEALGAVRNSIFINLTFKELR